MKLLELVYVEYNMLVAVVECNLAQVEVGFESLKLLALVRLGNKLLENPQCSIVVGVEAGHEHGLVLRLEVSFDVKRAELAVSDK